MSSLKTLRIGDNGSEVKELQSLLGIVSDGSFGAKTQSAVMDFQKKNGLTQDGVVGVATWGLLGKKKPITQREKLIDKFGDPMEDKRAFEKKFNIEWIIHRLTVSTVFP